MAYLIDPDQVLQEFDADAFEAGKVIAPTLVGCVALARLSGVDSMKPFWLRSTPVPSIANGSSTETSASSFYSDIKNIATPWRPCIIFKTSMNPWYTGIELVLLPIAHVKRPSTPDAQADWVPISPNKSLTGAFGAVEMEPPWPDSDSFIRVGHPFKMRCRAHKVHISGAVYYVNADFFRKLI